MSVPTRDFRSSTNRRLQGVGVVPDVRVLPTLEDVRSGRDPTIERAVRLISAGGGGHPEEQPTRFRGRRGEFFPPI
jgi:C-terminal processing protease CtpA/Prc